MFRRIRTVLIVLASALVLGIGTLVVLANVYEDEVKARLIGAINDRLNTPVSVRSMDLTLIARFPQASMRLDDVLAKEVRSDGAEPDTLLFAEQLFLEFSLWDLFQGDYTIQQVHGTHVRLFPALDANGAENFIVWKSDSTSTVSAPIALDKVSFEGLHVRYRDGRSALEIRTFSKNLALSGRFSDASNELTLSGDALVDHWIQNGEVVLNDRQAHLRLALAFGGPDGAFRITKGEVNTGDVPLEVTLALVRGPKGRELDLRANGLGLDLADVVLLLPESLSRQFTRYGMKGDVDLAVHYAGPLAGDGPSLSIGAKVAKGRMQEKRTGAAFTEIRGELALDLTPKGVPQKITVKNFSARSGSGSISGNWKSTGLKNAQLKADLRGDIALADLLRFAQVDTLEQVSGRLQADAHVEGRLRDVGDLRASDLKVLKITGTAALRDATLKLKGIRHRVTHLDADLALQGNDATVQGLKVEFQENPITLTGTLHNLMPYLLFEDQHLVIEARGASPRIDLAALLRSEGASSSAKDYALVLPAAVELDLQARVDELVFEEFKATDINGRLRMKDRRLSVSPMTFNTASGAVLGSLDLDARNPAGHYPLAINATIKDIDITQLFREFQDFGQDFIGSRHLSGRTNAQVAFNAPLSPAIQLDMDRLVCVVDIALENGAIKGHQPLLDVAEHLRKNKLVSPFVDTDELRKRLADVRFAHLENQIMIRDGAVHIPSMLVSSSVMDIELSGTHGFDDKIDHHLNFRLSDLFRTGEADDEFGPVVDDGTGMRIFLHMYGTADDPQFANDGAMASARRKKQFQDEKQELRSILREELGLFKGGGAPPTVAGNGTATTPKPTFQVDWGTADSTHTAGAQGPQRPRKGLGRLMDKDDEERATFEIEE